MCYGILSTVKTPSAGVLMHLYVCQARSYVETTAVGSTEYALSITGVAIYVAAECESRLIFTTWYRVLAKRFQTKCTGRSFPKRFRISRNVQQRLRPACAHLPCRHYNIANYYMDTRSPSELQLCMILKHAYSRMEEDSHLAHTH